MARGGERRSERRRSRGGRRRSDARRARGEREPSGIRSHGGRGHAAPRGHAAGLGTAYVFDRRGPDTVVIDTAPAARSDWTSRARRPIRRGRRTGSSSGRSAGACGCGRLPTTPPARLLRRPVPSAVFSPVFTSANTVVAVVGGAGTGVRAGPRTKGSTTCGVTTWTLGRWTRSRRSTPPGIGCSAIRTPLVRARRLDRVRRRARAYPPRSERAHRSTLWKVTARGAIVAKVRELPREMYLAGELDGHRVWNIYDDASRRSWRLFDQVSSDRLVDLRVRRGRRRSALRRSTPIADSERSG